MRKIIVLLILLCFPLVANAEGWFYAKAAPSGPTSPTYFTKNTADFDSLTYSTLNGNNQIISTGILDEIQSAYPTNQYFGNCTSKNIGYYTTPSISRALIKFDLSQLSGKTITAVQLKLYQSENNVAETVQVYKLTRGYVSAARSGTCNSTDDTSAVSWNEYSGTSTWTTSGGDYSATLIGSFTNAAPGWRTVTNQTNCGGGSTDCLLEYVQAIASGGNDYGLIFKASDESSNSRNSFAADIATDGLRPYLKVTWSN